MLLLVKVGLAFCALALTVVSIGFETLDRNRPGRWFRRLRPPGVVAVAAAIGVFGFGVANELMSERVKVSSEQRLNGEIQVLQSESREAAASLAEVRSQLISAREQLEQSIGISQGLRTVLDAMGGTLVRIASFEIAVHELPEIYREVPVAIRAGDEVEWNMVCHAGTPGLADHGGDNYGRFLADNMNPILVTGISGRSSVPANALVGASLLYELPWGSEGAALQRAMRQALCVLQVRLYREARHTLEDSMRLQVPDDELIDFSQRVED